MNYPFLRCEAEIQYCHIARRIMEHGDPRLERTGVGARSIFGPQMDFSVKDEFPLLTKKSMAWSQMVDELKWFISGSTNYKDLPERTQHWWSHWAYEDGELGPIYGKQLRDSSGVDQLADFVRGIEEDPYSRRHVISLWHAADLPFSALPACHGAVIQAFVSSSDELSLKMYQRSADMFLGVPYNIASYALFLYVLAMATNTVPNRLIMTFGDAHIYNNHTEQMQEYLLRPHRPAPKLVVNERLRGLGLKALEEFTHDDLELVDYNPDTAIKAPLAI